MKPICPHQGQCSLKDQPSQCPPVQPINDQTQAATTGPNDPNPQTLWATILEETVPSLPSW